MGCNTSKESLKQAVVDAKDDVKQTATEMKDAVYETAMDVKDAAIDTANDIKEGVTGVFRDLTGDEAKTNGVSKSAESICSDKPSNNSAAAASVEQEAEEKSKEEQQQEEKEQSEAPAAAEGEGEEEEAQSKEEVEAAATRIQAAFRGHAVRKNIMKDTDSTAQTAADSEPTKEQLEAEFRADDQDLTKAATRIQATFRGHMSRKVDQAADQAKDLVKNATEKIEEKMTDAASELEQIDLSDPDLHKAATKIQASFRGHKVRQEVVPEEKK